MGVWLKGSHLFEPIKKMKSIVPILVGFLGTYLNDSIQFSLMNTSFAFWLMEDEEKYLLLAKMTHFCLHMTYCWKLITFPIKLVGLFQMSDWFSNGISEILKIIFKISFLNKENCRDSRTIMIYVFRNQICKTCEYKISRTLGWRMIDPNWFENFEMQLSLIEIKIQKLFFSGI